MITLHAVYILAGLVFAAYALLNALDRSHPTRIRNTLFWALVAASFLAGDYFGDLGNGLLVVALACTAGLGKLGQGAPVGPSHAERLESARALGAKLFVPALIIPAVVLVGALWLKTVQIGGAPLLETKQATLISLAMGAVIALAVALPLLRQPLIAPLQEGRRLIETVGWAVLLPQMLAALGAVFALAGVGKVVGDLVTTWIPMDTKLIAICVYCGGMALFTVIMGNAFAAFPVMTAGVALPFLIGRFGGDAAVICALGMLSGFCGTLMTPLAANFNVVPVRLLELKDRYAVIRAQVPTALPLLFVNMVLMYVLAFRALTADIASKFAGLALGHVAREYPNKLDHVMSGLEDAVGVRELHPIFYGSYDWHSCVHGYWLLATLRRLHPDIPEAAAIDALFADAFTAEKVEVERAYLDRPSARGFERPYGWAWLLKLQAELLAHDAPWAERMAPLAEAFADRFREFLPRATYPIRTGVHSSTAFALALAHDYALAAEDASLSTLLRDKARGWYGLDRGCQAWEPSGDDFLSPALMEAECLRRVLDPQAFRAWFQAFLPDAAVSLPATLFAPATVSDRSDGKIAHLDGLNLSRAWCWRAIAAALSPADPVRAVALDAAERHLAASLPHVAGDYMGEHWLASFALLALMTD